jgi:hypothetical protein
MSGHFANFLLQTNGDCILQLILLQLAGFLSGGKTVFQKNLK